MYSHTSRELKSIEGQLISITCGDAVLSYRDVFAKWINDGVFRDYFTTLLTSLPYSAIRWETPHLTSNSAHRPFECVVINSPGLIGSADKETFRDLFSRIDDSGVGTFPNLGGDAIMILPGPVDDDSAYSHLLSFLKTAPAQQLHSFWQLVGACVLQRLGDKPLWLNTAGGGVSWLHVRLDDRPKYYVYRPYRDAAVKKQLKLD